MHPPVFSPESALKAQHFDADLSLGADGECFSGFFICMYERLHVVM